MGLRVLNVNDTLDLKEGGGTAERTFQMTRFLGKLDTHCEVLTMASQNLTAERISELKPSKVSVIPCFFKRYKIPFFSLALIFNAVRHADIIHLMGHWSLLNATVYLIARFYGKNYVVCPAGALPIFGRSKLLKKIYNFVIGRSIITNASGWIAVTIGEYSHFEEYGVASSDIKVIPNGVSAADFPVIDVSGFRLKYKLPDEPVVLFMGRLNPIKGPDLLLQAFLDVRKYFPKYHLVYAGPDGGAESSLRETIADSEEKNFIHFIGYVEGMDKVAAYRMATLLVVPSRQEAMSIVAVEAGMCGVPVLLTDQCGFSEIKLIDEKLEVPASKEGIANGLKNILSETKVLEKISASWSDFVISEYSWESIAPKYIEFYKTLVRKFDV